ncbi:MAG: protein translocase subunit SecD [Candidatus Bipolaricaulota bacterium]|nr:protein translocase subunit SecD [Candidatus Bipolaricaulota bacterium]
MAHSSMTRRDWIRFGAVVLALVGSLYLIYPFWPLQDVVNLGLDLQGGVRMVLEAQQVEEMTSKQKQDTLDRIITILNNRVDQYGLANAEIKQMGTGRVLVNLPGTKDPQEARDLIGSTAILEFRKVIEAGTSPTAEVIPTSATQDILEDRDKIPYVVEGEPLLTGAALSDARVRVSQSMQAAGQLYIALTFNQDGAKRFVEALRKLRVDDRLAIVLDNMIYSAPRITQSIKDAAAQGWRSVQNSTTISGKFTKDEATRVAIVLRAGALPVAVQVAEENTVGPTLGSDSIQKGMMTIAIGFILVLFYMPIYYRLIGIVADVALLLNMMIVFAALVLFQATLTLPGIAGIILTIGMTVDANVIVFERLKEERRAGKSPLAAVRAGFDKSLSTLLDANVTTLLAALILLLIGTGPIKGFAITLGIGIVGSLFCTLVASRLLLERAGFSEYVPVRPQEGS